MSRGIITKPRDEWMKSAITATILVLVAFLLVAAEANKAVAAGVNQYSSPQWFPLRGTWVVGCTWNNGCDSGYHGYAALDIARNSSGSIAGDPVYAAGAGLATITSTGSTCGGPGTAGNVVSVDHGNGVKSYYYHLGSFAISSNTWVDENTVLGYVGHTGYVVPCTFNHLHFEVRINGNRVSPGQLKACHGSQLVTYPAAFSGSPSDWNQVPRWSQAHSDGTTCATAGLSVTGPLTVTAPSGYYVGAPINATFTVKNVSSSTVTVTALILAVRNPAGANQDLWCAGPVTLAPNATKTCTFSNNWGSAGTYTIWPAWQNTSGQWIQAPQQTFTLSN